MSADDHEQNPPRIVSETPLGGVPKPAHGTPEEIEELHKLGVPDNFVDHLKTVGPEDVSDSVNIPPKSDPPVEELDPDRATVPGDVQAAELAQEMRRARTHDEDSQELQKVTLDTTTETPIVANPQDAPFDQPAAVQEEASDWDDDLSPELAAVLFAAKPKPADRAPAAAPTPPASPVAPATPAPVPAAPSKPAPAATPTRTAPAEPVQLTSRDDAHHLVITAAGYAAPAPDAPLDAKVRYVRTEEPLKEDQGQRIAETWEYFKGVYPALNGRLVREVSREELRYADGSWKWTYERRYEDRGHDRREVRANADSTYFERDDMLSVVDAEGKRSQHAEEAALIFAPTEVEEKRGGLLGSLFGRDKDESAASGAAVWRPAASAEAKQARREGGDAFDRSLFERLF